MRKHPSFSFLYFHNFERLREQEEELEKEEKKRKTTIYERRLYRLAGASDLAGFIDAPEMNGRKKYQDRPSPL